MFKIGDFSKLAQVSVKALRHYDELGLLKPAAVDSQTGYRWYTADQMPRLNRILVLKSLGFGLEQIGVLMDGQLDAGQLREMYRARQAQIADLIKQEKNRMALLAVRLREIEEEGDITMSNGYDVIIKRVEPVLVCALRETIPAYDQVGMLWERLCGQIAQSGARFAGPGIAVYFDTEYKERDVDVETAMPVAGPAAGLAVKEYPAIETAACAIHRGPYEGLSAAYAAIGRWIQENGWEIIGPNREVYLLPIDQAPDPSQCVTEIQFPVRKAGS
ncbi:MAG: MerR family transcriptional regulator [Solirubrobacterales bacterium]